MRVAVYIRVSTDEQANEGYSISAQRERLTAYCLSQEWTVAGAYIEEGRSAKDMDRPELQRLLTNAESGLFDVVLVYKLDRLTRSVLDLYTLLQTFERFNVKFKSATELYDTTTAMGKLFITLVAALAQWERENLGERVRVGMEQMVIEGKRPGGPIPFGYDKDLKAVPEEKWILRELRRLYVEERLGFYSIAKALNARGLHRRDGGEWSSFTVYSVLDNPFYAGKLRWGTKTRGGKYVSRKMEDNVDFIVAESDHEAIFTWDEYEEHKTRMKSREYGGYSKKTDYWFAGLLRCAKCGSAMTGRVKKNRTRKDGVTPLVISYICSNKQLRGVCKMPIMRQELVEKLFLDHLSNFITQREEDVVLGVKERSRTEPDAIDNVMSDIERLDKEIATIKERKRKWQNLLINEKLTEDEYDDRIKEERMAEEIAVKRKTELTGNIPKAKANIHDIKTEQVIGVINAWPMLDDIERNRVARIIYKWIEIDTPIESAYGLARRGKFLPAKISKYQFNEE